MWIWNGQPMSVHARLLGLLTSNTKLASLLHQWATGVTLWSLWGRFGPCQEWSQTDLPTSGSIEIIYLHEKKVPSLGCCIIRALYSVKFHVPTHSGALSFCAFCLTAAEAVIENHLEQPFCLQPIRCHSCNRVSRKDLNALSVSHYVLSCTVWTDRTISRSRFRFCFRFRSRYRCNVTGP